MPFHVCVRGKRERTRFSMLQIEREKSVGLDISERALVEPESSSIH